MTATPSRTPRIREGVHARVLGDEVVVTDESGKTAHVLRDATARAWSAVVGGEAAPAADAEFEAALSELIGLGLVEPGRGASRRDFLRQAGTVAVGASVITIGLPAIHAAASTSHPTTTSLNPAPASPAPGTVVLNADVIVTNPTAGDGHLAASGSVQFQEEVSAGTWQNVGTAQAVVAGSKATTTLTGVSGGSHTYRASFTGTAPYGSSVSPKLSVSVTGAQPATTPPSLVASSTANNGGNNSTITINKPTGVVAGDVMIAQIASDGVVTVASSGWTVLRKTDSTGQGTDMSQTILMKTATATDALVTTTGYQFSLSANARTNGGLLLFRGVSQAPTAGQTAGTGSSGLTLSAPAIDLGGEQRIVVTLFGLKVSDTVDQISTPSGFTSVYEERQGTVMTASADRRTYGAGESGTKGPFTATATSSAKWVAQTVVIRGSG